MKVKGTVKPARSGYSIEIGFYYQGQQHRETIKMPPTAENLRACQKILAGVQTAIAMEDMGGKRFEYTEFFPNSKWVSRRKAYAIETGHVKAALHDWLNEQTLKPTTLRCYRLAIADLCEHFGELRLDELTIEAIRRWIKDQQNEKITVKTINNKLLPLRGMLNTAVERGHIEFNPLLKLGKIRATEYEKVRALQTSEIDPFDLDEIAAVLKKGPAPLTLMFQFGVYTGLRTGELFALAWEDIDFVHGTARIWKARTEKNLVTPKTKSSVRTLTLLPKALDALKALKEYTFLRKPVDCGEFGLLRFVFYSPTTDAPYIEGQQLSKTAWPNMLRKAGVRYRYPYQTRHTFASLCLSCGENEKWVANQMGHTDVSMVRRHYGRWLEQAAEASGNAGGEKVRKLMEGI